MSACYGTTQKPVMGCEPDHESKVGREMELGMKARNYQEANFEDGLKIRIMHSVGFHCTDYTYWDEHLNHTSKETRLSFLKRNPTSCLGSPSPGDLVLKAA